MLVAAARCPQIIHTFFVNREKAHRRAVFGRHVRNRRAVHDRQRRRARTEKFHKLPDHLRLAKHFRGGEREVGRGDAFAQCAGYVNADNVWCEKIYRLAEHAGFGFDAADAPSDDAEAVDHRCVRIRADERVEDGRWEIGVGRWGRQDAFGEIFQIDLMHDADAGWNDLERIERLHAPFQKLIALAVALEFHLQILFQRVG